MMVQLVLMMHVLLLHAMIGWHRVAHHVAGLLERQLQRLVLVVRARRPGFLVILVEHHRLVERALVHIVQ